MYEQQETIGTFNRVTIRSLVDRKSIILFRLKEAPFRNITAVIHNEPMPRTCPEISVHKIREDILLRISAVQRIEIKVEDVR